MSATVESYSMPFWGVQPCDTPESFYWFSLYLTTCLPPRDNLRPLLRVGFPGTAERLERMAAEGHWRRRSELYDAHLAERAKAIVEYEVEEAARGRARRLLAARRVTELGDREVSKLLRDQTQGTLLRPETALRYVERGIATEHAILGLQPPETGQAADYSGLSDDELEQALALAAKAQGPK